MKLSKFIFCSFICLNTLSFYLGQIVRNCTNFIPQNKDECLQFSTPGSYCCFVTNGQNEFTNHCDVISPALYMTSKNWTIFSGYNMTVDCGQVYSERNLQSCGGSVVTSMTDCTTFSTMDNSCCYYNYYGAKGCILYPEKMDRSIVLGNVILQCDGWDLFHNLYFLVLLFIVSYL